jgi:hypothetical protein
MGRRLGCEDDRVADIGALQEGHLLGKVVHLLAVAGLVM